MYFTSVLPGSFTTHYDKQDEAARTEEGQKRTDDIKTLHKGTSKHIYYASRCGGKAKGWMDRVKNAVAPSLTAHTTETTKNGHATLRTHASSVDSYMDASYKPVKDMLSFSATARTTAPRVPGAVPTLFNHR